MRMQLETEAAATAGKGTNFWTIIRVVGVNLVARRSNKLNPTAIPHAEVMAPAYLNEGEI